MLLQRIPKVQVTGFLDSRVPQAQTQTEQNHVWKRSEAPLHSESKEF